MSENNPPTADPLTPIYLESFVENPTHQKDLRNRDTALQWCCTLLIATLRR